MHAAGDGTVEKETMQQVSSKNTSWCTWVCMAFGLLVGAACRWKSSLRLVIHVWQGLFVQVEGAVTYMQVDVVSGGMA